MNLNWSQIPVIILRCLFLCICISQDEVNGYVCVCQSGWYGDDCQLEVNECEANPCLNGATCMVSELQIVHWKCLYCVFMGD